MPGQTGAGRRLISVVLPVYNEEANVEPAYAALCSVFDRLDDYEPEIVFADNHSSDGTFTLLAELARRDPRVKVLRFNRNYGFQRSLLTAYRHSRGDAAIQLDCDLQDPPELIPELLARWEQGHDVVVGLRRRRPESSVLSLVRRQFYALLERISEEELPKDAGDFRLIDRKILDRLGGVQDLHPYVRGLVSSFATNQAGVPYDRNARRYGQSKFPPAKLIGFGLNAIFGHSPLPLRLAAYSGLLLAAITFAGAAYLLIAGVADGDGMPSGSGTTTLLLLLGMSLNAIFLGILGEYVHRIYDQVRRRPMTVIERTINVDVEGGNGD